MKTGAIVIGLAFILAISPILASIGSADSGDSDDSYLIEADGFTISINSSYPAISFYKDAGSEPVFSISYDRLALYSEDLSSPEYHSDLSSSLWDISVGKSTEEDGTVRTVVSMSSTLSLSGSSDIEDWGTLSFTFLILAKGDKAQLGISMDIAHMKPIDSCSNLAIVQSIYGDATFMPDSNEIIVSDIYYRWNPTATVNLNGLKEERDVNAQYSDGSLSLIYPYSPNMIEIIHVSGQVDFVVMRDYFSDMIGYSLGVMAGFGLFGISYAMKNRRKKSPFDMDSPIYRK